MLGRLFRSDGVLDGIASDIYGAIVARARTPAIYADLGVPDTVAGRFEMVALHMVVAMERFGSGTHRERDIGQRVFELFCTDMDQTLREFGVGDAVMGKRMKKMARGFYGRSAAYTQALTTDDRDQLAAVLGRNIYPGEERAADVRLSDYARSFRLAFIAVESGALEKGAVAVPLPSHGTQ